MPNHFHLVVETPEENLVAGMAWLALAPIRRAWCFGSPEFRRQMLQKLDGELGEGHAGWLRREHGEQKAERIIAEELKRLGWSEADLVSQRKKAPGKLDLAARLRRETTMSLKWIAERVHLGTPKTPMASCMSG